METNEKQFDAVKIMREIRDKLSHDFEGMSFKEEKAYIKRYVNAFVCQDAKRKTQSTK
jgi:hypothetical protein